MKLRLVMLVLVILLVGSSSALLAQAQSTLPNGVASGDVTQTSAVLWTHSTEKGTVTFEYATDADFTTIAGTLTVEVTDPMQPVKAVVDGLTPGRAYYYRVTDAAGNTASGKFRTAAEVGAKKGLRFGVSGDWRGELAPYPSIANADDADLDFFVEHGDTIYADYPSPDLDKPLAETLAEYRIKHNEVYSARYDMNTWADLRASTSILATIDDHEVLNDFAGGAAPASNKLFADYAGEFINDTERYKQGLQAFGEYNPLRDATYTGTGDARFDGKPNLYRYNTYGSDAAVFVLDARSFRDQELNRVTDLTNRTQVFLYLAGTYNAQRTMLGKPQLAALKADLTTAQKAGITWKFILVPEPMQNLGIVYSEDRFEGYAAERTDLLKFIVDNQISNVVFVAADIHCMLVNDVGYTTGPLSDPIPTGTFEVVTGSVAYDAPFGPTVVELAGSLGLIDKQQVAAFQKMSPDEQEDFMTTAINAQIEPLKFSLIGLDGSDINAKLVQGRYQSTITYGWTQFEIDAATQALTVTSYGIPYYTKKDLDADPKAVTARVPVVVSQFVVTPK